MAAPLESNRHVSFKPDFKWVFRLLQELQLEDGQDNEETDDDDEDDDDDDDDDNEDEYGDGK